MTKSISLPTRLDSSAAKGLADEILKNLGDPITLDGAEVESCGALCLQVLLATKKQWDSDGVEANIHAPSVGLLDACKVLGVTPQEIGCMEVV